MTWGAKIADAADMFRLSLGGAMFGSALSACLGDWAELGRSLNRDMLWAVAGCLVCLALLVDERRRKRGSAEADPVAADIEVH